MEELQKALSLYQLTCNQYPPRLLTTENAGCPGGTTLGTYMSSIPTDPSSGLSYAYTAFGSGTVCTAYHIGTKLEDSSKVVLNTDVDAAASASSKCTNGSWAGNADIAASSGDFDGTNDATNRIYDIRF